MTSQSLWSLYDRHFAGITCHNALSYVVKIYGVIPIKLNQLVKMSTWSLTYQQSVLKRDHSDKHLSEFLPKDAGKNQLA